MSTQQLTRSDAQIQHSVETALTWAPDVDAASIGVAVESGCVQLSGSAPSYAQKSAAVQATSHVRGVRAIADEIEVRGPMGVGESSDLAIAQAIAAVLASSASIPSGVHAEVRKGAVTLLGEVTWNYQRELARRLVGEVRHVRWVDDRITMSARPSSPETHDRIRAALERNARVDSDAIGVVVHGTSVTLSGSVRSLDEKRAAVREAWASPHVTAVEDAIVVVPRGDSAEQPGLDV